jgi:hypothetical protein
MGKAYIYAESKTACSKLGQMLAQDILGQWTVTQKFVALQYGNALNFTFSYYGQ